MPACESNGVCSSLISVGIGYESHIHVLGNKGFRTAIAVHSVNRVTLVIMSLKMLFKC